MNALLPQILLIDDQWAHPDEPLFRERYGRLPFEWRYTTAQDVTGEFSAQAALKAVQTYSPAAILLDIMFGEQERLGIEILEALRTQYPLLPILMFTDVTTDEQREVMIRCIEVGANEYIDKSTPPVKLEEIASLYTGSGADTVLWGNSAPMRQLRASLARVSFSGSTSVLIQGESGTGKELVASTVYRLGTRRTGAFVAKNCAHSDSQLLESELFGHTRGSFTGAVRDRKGLIEEAHGGVLFLDEIADITQELQAKLLRVLEVRSFRRLGENAERSSDFQLLCATNRSPDDLVNSGRLRADFFYRIAGLTIQVPPLRQRLDDIPVLADLFLRRLKERGAGGYPGESFSPAALREMMTYLWPGNVRELRNFVERNLILSTDRTIEVSTPARNQPGLGTAEPAAAKRSELPSDPVDWPRQRLRAELEMCLKAKALVQSYKGSQWRAEFMRLMYPECKAANAKGLADVVKRLTRGPWGDPRWTDDPEIRRMIEEFTK